MGCWIGRSDVFSPPHDLVDVRGRAPILVVGVRAVVEQTAALYEVAVGVDRGQAVAGRKASYHVAVARGEEFR